MWTKRAGQSPNANGEASELNTYKIVSFDKHFDNIEGLTRLRPQDIINYNI
jgi:hypothetical protein